MHFDHYHAADSLEGLPGPGNPKNATKKSEVPSLTTCFFLGVMAWGEGDIQMSDIVVVVVDGPPQGLGTKSNVKLMPPELLFGSSD